MEVGVVGGTGREGFRAADGVLISVNRICRAHETTRRLVGDEGWDRPKARA